MMTDNDSVALDASDAHVRVVTHEGKEAAYCWTLEAFAHGVAVAYEALEAFAVADAALASADWQLCENPYAHR